MFETQTNLYILANTPTKKKTRLGFGTFSLIMVIFAYLFSFSVGDNAPLGDILLKSIGCNPYDGYKMGFHYTMLFSLSISFIAWYIADKFYYQIGARLASLLSKYFSIVLSIIVMIYIFG